MIDTEKTTYHVQKNEEEGTKYSFCIEINDSNMKVSKVMLYFYDFLLLLVLRLFIYY